MTANIVVVVGWCWNGHVVIINAGVRMDRTWILLGREWCGCFFLGDLRAFRRDVNRLMIEVVVGVWR